MSPAAPGGGGRERTFEVWPLKFAGPAELASYRAALVKLDEAMEILPRGTYRTSILRTAEWMRKELRERDERASRVHLAAAPVGRRDGGGHG